MAILQVMYSNSYWICPCIFKELEPSKAKVSCLVSSFENVYKSQALSAFSSFNISKIEIEILSEVDKPQSSWYDARWSDLLEGTAVTKQDRDLSNLPSVTHQSHWSAGLEIHLPELLSPHLSSEKFKNIVKFNHTQSDIIIALTESSDWWHER